MTMEYSKIWGSLIGGVIGIGISKFGLPAEFGSPEIVGALTALVSAIGTWLAPPNKAA